MGLVAEYSYGVAIKGRFEENGEKRFAWRIAGSDEWGGLNGYKQEDLPLYGELRGSPVFVLEGEKAVDACKRQGLAAVCFAGGAGTKSFGAAIEQLRGANVVLWPDNDPVGRELMQRLKRELAGVAGTVRVVAPSVPLKGDAWDYFEAGGSAELLVPSAMTPVCVQLESGFAVTIPGLMGTALFLCDEMEAPKAGELNAELTVSYQPVGREREAFSARLNLLSLSSRSSLARELEGIMPLGKGEWPRMLGRMVEMVREAWLSSVQSVGYADVALDFTVPRYRVDRFLPEGAVTALFGQGDAGKGHLACHLSLCVASGRAFQGRASMQGRVMYCDWEDDEREWAARMFRHSLGLNIEVPEGVSYYPGRGIPLQQQVQAIRREVERRRADVVVIDSVIPACGGNPNAPETPGPFFNALRRLGCTVLLIAHNTKEDNDRHILGSVMWDNLCRCTWYVKRSEGDEHIVGLYHRKRNRMPPQAPMGLRIVFDADDAGPVWIRGQEIGGDLEQIKNMSAPKRVEALLAEGPMLRRDVEKLAGISSAHLRKVIQREHRIMGDGDSISWEA